MVSQTALALAVWALTLAFSPLVQQAHGPSRVDSIAFTQLLMLAHASAALAR